MPLSEPAGAPAPPPPVDAPGAPVRAAAAARPRMLRSYAIGRSVVFAFSGLCILGFFALLLRHNPDPGIRVWLLNHTPDQVAIINPFNGVIEKKFQVADGLRELAFSRDYSKAYVANVVDVSNRITVLNTQTYLKEETVEVDGVPQGFGVFPDNRKLACVLGSKTDFMAGGFDVIDLKEWSKADPNRKKRLWRERDLALTHKIAVSDDGDRVYLIDAKKPLINIYSYSRKEQIGTVDLQGAPEEMLYPPAGKYYYVSVLVHNTIYQLDKQSDRIVGAYIYGMPEPDKMWENHKRLRYMAVDSKGAYLYATLMEDKSIAVWQVDNPNYSLDYTKIPPDPQGKRKIAPVTYYLPKTAVKLKGGYRDNLLFVPGGKQIVLDPTDQYVFVVDEEGALYIYKLKDIQQGKYASTPEPVKIVPLQDDAEIRDIKVSRPAVRFPVAGGDTKEARRPDPGGGA